MSLRDEIALGLKNGSSLTALVEVVRRHKHAGLSQQSAYQVLETMWLEFGCQESGEDDSPVCGLLGGLLDRVWGYCSSKEAIWDTSLSSRQ